MGLVVWCLESLIAVSRDLIVSLRIVMAYGWGQCSSRWSIESSCGQSGHLIISVCRCGSFRVLFAWFLPCQCLSSSIRVRSSRCDGLVESCHSVEASGRLK